MELHLSSNLQAELAEYAQRHGKDPAKALDEIVTEALAWERQDQQEAVAGIQRGYESLKAGRTRPAAEFLRELREKYDFPG